MIALAVKQVLRWLAVAAMIGMGVGAAYAQPYPSADNPGSTFGGAVAGCIDSTGAAHACGIKTPLRVFDEATFTDWYSLTAASSVYSVPTSSLVVVYNCTASGNITLTSATGNVMTIPLAVGYSILPFLPKTFTTTATATFWGAQ